MSVDIVRHWRLKAQRYRLVGQTCPDCSQAIFPPRPVCPHCTELEPAGFVWNLEGATSPAWIAPEGHMVSQPALLER